MTNREKALGYFNDILVLLGGKETSLEDVMVIGSFAENIHERCKGNGDETYIKIGGIEFFVPYAVQEYVNNLEKICQTKNQN